MLVTSSSCNSVFPVFGGVAFPGSISPGYSPSLCPLTFSFHLLMIVKFLLLRVLQNPSCSSDAFSVPAPATWFTRPLPLRRSHWPSVVIIYLRLCPLCILLFVCYLFGVHLGPFFGWTSSWWHLLFAIITFSQFVDKTSLKKFPFCWRWIWKWKHDLN